MAYGLIGPLIRLLEPETAHNLTIRALKWGLVPGFEPFEDGCLRLRLWDRDFPNPVGLAAGFDKNAEVPDRALALGFGFVEAGSVTPRPQAGNPRPRLFRLARDRAVINRLGFNNDGLEAVAGRLRGRSGRGIVGVNLGVNRDSADAAADYTEGARALAGLADYLVVNVSSPNTPGVRALQGRRPLEGLAPGRARGQAGRWGRSAGPAQDRPGPDRGRHGGHRRGGACIRHRRDDCHQHHDREARRPHRASGGARPGA